ncbi:MAG: type II toxin-antitoxin system RelB/DinJ family antitoxin [Propionibacteriaceae bacterium]|nr:type II toxin-antitoxin system RelB/DinJ family antitoxin [Propionibacteriaceae bacterium]
MSKQVATRITEEEDQRFKEITKTIGTTPSDALRMFIAAFNAAGGFPFVPRIKPQVEAFATEEEATEFATSIARKMLDAQG